MIIENDFNRQMQVIEQTNANALDKTKSSKIAQQIDQLHRDHKMRKSSKNKDGNTYPSVISQTDIESYMSGNVAAAAAAPS